MNPFAMRRFLLIAIGILFLSSCSRMQSKPAMEPIRTPPTNCLKLCADLIAPQSSNADTIRIWTVDLVNQYGECRRAHKECVEFVQRSTGSDVKGAK